MIYSHWSHAPWDSKRWPNFGPWEFASPDNGQLYWDPSFFDKMQALRTVLGLPIVMTSAHRSFRHNLAVGGAVLSMHKTMAADVSLIGHNRFHVLVAALSVGFTGTGYYKNFIHLDLGRRRFWYGAGAKPYWDIYRYNKETT